MAKLKATQLKQHFMKIL